MARGEYVVKLDSDDILDPQFVSVLLNGLERYPDAGWAHCNPLLIHPDKTPITLAHTRKKSGFSCARDLTRLYLQRSDTRHVVMLKKEAYDKVGGYRPEMLTTEDRLLWLEMIMAGYGYFYSDQVLARMRSYSHRSLMSQRRKEYIVSIRFMQMTIEEKWTQDVEALLGVSRQEAIDLLRRSLSATCLAAGIGELSEEVRAALLEESFSLAVTFLHKLYCRLWALLPRTVARFLWKAKSEPRRVLRDTYQNVRGRGSRSRIAAEESAG